MSEEQKSETPATETTETEATDNQDVSTENKFYPNESKETVDNKSQEEGEGESSEEQDSSTDKDEEDKGEKSKAEKSKEEFEASFSEDTNLLDSDKERIEAYIKEQGLGKEEAEKFIAQNEKIVEGHNNRLVAKHKEVMEEWRQDALADKEIGGAKLEESLSNVDYALSKAGPDIEKEFRAEINKNGFANHKLFIKMFSRMGKQMRAADEVSSNNTSTKEKTLAEKFYGNKEDS